MSLRRFMHRKEKDADLAQEIESHLAHEQDVNQGQGLSPEEARRQARLKFGNPESTATSLASKFFALGGKISGAIFALQSAR
jgi:hypothetical protein